MNIIFSALKPERVLASSRYIRNVFIRSLLFLTQNQTTTYTHIDTQMLCFQMPLVSLVCNEHCMANNSSYTLHSRSHSKFTVQIERKAHIPKTQPAVSLQ